MGRGKEEGVYHRGEEAVMGGEGRGTRDIEGERDVTGRGQSRVTYRAVLRSVSREKCRARDRGRWRGRHLYKTLQIWRLLWL
jgi:hypothetical protein